MARSTCIGYREKLENPGVVGDVPLEEVVGCTPIDFADFEDPSRAAAAARPSAEKFEMGEGSSTFFFPPKREPKKPSFSFLVFSLSLSFLSFFEKKPPFFSFSFSFSFSLTASTRCDSGRESKV